MTIIYEVSLKIDPDIQLNFLSWLNDHVSEMLQLPGFLSGEIFQEITVSDIVKQSDYAVRYELKDEAALQNYIAHFSQKMRADGLRRFGNQFQASRKVFKPIPSQ